MFSSRATSIVVGRHVVRWTLVVGRHVVRWTQNIQISLKIPTG
jgi:hypothetical protein